MKRILAKYIREYHQHDGTVYYTAHLTIFEVLFGVIPLPWVTFQTICNFFDGAYILTANNFFSEKKFVTLSEAQAALENEITNIKKDNQEIRNKKIISSKKIKI
jgi:hypothetical protein